MKLSFFCKTHNQLCCAACLSVINNNIYGQHKDCEVCNIEEIKIDKKNILTQNMEFLKKLSIYLNAYIKKLEILFENMNEEKENIKNKISIIFTKIRNEINRREDKFYQKLIINLKTYV